MNKPLDPSLFQSAEAFADYLTNTAARIDAKAEARAHDDGARVGISRPHESAALHVAGEATYIDDIPELAGTLHCALGLSPVANGRLKNMKLEAICAMPGVVAVLTAADIPGSNDCGSIDRQRSAIEKAGARSPQRSCFSAAEIITTPPTITAASRIAV